MIDINKLGLNPQQKTFKRVLLSEFDAVENDNELARMPKNPKLIKLLKQAWFRNNKNVRKYSDQQVRIISSDKRRIIGNAGAGSGKTHTIGGRIMYLKICGQNPRVNIGVQNILALTYTNVDAKNISNRYNTPKDKINSYTMDDYFNKIYNMYYGPTMICSIGTFYNSLGTFDTNSSIMRDRLHGRRFGLQYGHFTTNDVNRVRSRIKGAIYNHYIRGRGKTSKDRYLWEMYLIIYYNYSITRLIFCTMHKITLNLEQLVLYVQFKKHPSTFKRIRAPLRDIKYIIVDEVQDVSTLHFTLLFQMCRLYKANLMMMGDASQTIYRFQGADERYLEWLSSDLYPNFTVYSLSQNYRSNNGILALDNNVTKHIKANATNMELKNGMYDPASLKEFQKQVQMVDVPRLKSVSGSIVTTIKNINNKRGGKIRKWILEKYRNHESVAILSYSHIVAQNVLTGIKQLIRDDFPNDNPTSFDLAAGRSIPFTLLSSVAYHGREQLKRITWSSKDAFINAIYRLVVNEYRNRRKFHQKVDPKQLDVAQKLLHNYEKSPRFKRLARDPLSLGGMFIQNVCTDLDDIETQYSAKLHQIQEQRRSKIKKMNLSNYDFIVSTIHSIKGLQFQNCLIIYDERPSYPNEPLVVKIRRKQSTLRLYHVALTRAQKSEMIINSYEYNSMHPRKIDYKSKDDFKMSPLACSYKLEISKLKEKQQH